jgi:hypothetical protein
MTTDPAPGEIDYDIHGLVGIRLLGATTRDAAAVAKQLGPMRGTLTREPDIVIRFVDRVGLESMDHLGLAAAGFDQSGFYILRSSKRPAKVRIDFSEIGGPCEILCESGLRSVPLLLAILNLTMLSKGLVAAHASAFLHQGVGVLVTGWAKGGKTEALLSFSCHGAEYVGDEWILLSGDGERMYGVPENIRLWDWHLDNMPHVKKLVAWEDRLLFRGIRWMGALEGLVSRSFLGKAFPARVLREAMPALRRQLNVTLAPADIFGASESRYRARPDRVFLLLSHSGADVRIEAVDPTDLAHRMAASVRFELMPFMEQYYAYVFAFPDRRNPFIEEAHEQALGILTQALEGKETWVVRHPYPFSFQALYEKMKPFCDS